MGDMAVDTTLNINLMNLCLEILDNEHDLNRATGEINPLYIYCKNHIKGPNWGTFKQKTYETSTERINVHSILDKMKTILGEREGTFIPAGKPGEIKYKYEESTRYFKKAFEDLRKNIKDTDTQVGNSVMETLRDGIAGGPTNNVDGRVNVWRSDLTNQFDNSCTWNHPSVKLANSTIIGEKGTLDGNRIYDNYFPKAASVFVYGSELGVSDDSSRTTTKSAKKGNAANPSIDAMINAAVTTIIDLIPINGRSTSVLPFTSEELKNIKVELLVFINDVAATIEVDKLYLLHIFKVFNPNNTGGGLKPQYSFSLQHGQVALNDVSMELYGVNKRGSKLCNILCNKSAPVSTTMNNSMFFSDGMLPHMRNCHISYGKLCGDGVTIFAAKKAKFTGGGYNALISFDEFCCLRAVYAGIIVAYQQRPSAIAGSGFGWLVGNRTHGIFQCGNIKLSKEALAAKQKEEGDRAEAAKVAAETEALNVSANTLIAIIFNIFYEQTEAASAFIDEFLRIIDDNYKIIITDIYNALPTATPPRLEKSIRAELVKKIKAAFGTSEEIYKMQTFCVNYNNILKTISNTNIILTGSTRGVQDKNDRTMDDLFGGLGSLEELIKTYLPPNTAIHYTASRRHIVYIMITRLFIKTSFNDNINDFVNTLFNIDFIAPPQMLTDDTDQPITIGPNTELSYTEMGLVKTKYFPIDNGVRKLPDKDLYNNMLTIYNIFNQYNSYEDLNDNKITAAQCNFKNKLRQRLVIFKYIYRANTTRDLMSEYDNDFNDDIFNDDIFNDDIFNYAYNLMISDKSLTISSPLKSPADKAEAIQQNSRQQATTTANQASLGQDTATASQASLGQDTASPSPTNARILLTSPPGAPTKSGENRAKTYSDSQDDLFAYNLGLGSQDFYSQSSAQELQMAVANSAVPPVVNPLHTPITTTSPGHASSGSAPGVKTPEKILQEESLDDVREIGLGEVITDDRFRDNPDEPQCGDFVECPLDCDDDRVLGTKVNREGEATSEPKMSIVEIIVDNVINEEFLLVDVTAVDRFLEDKEYLEKCKQSMIRAVKTRLGQGFKATIGDKAEQDELIGIAKLEFQKCRHDYSTYGGRTTRKRKPSKTPRRTIRRRAPRRAQKRTLRRRQRRNKKGTQKRRK